MPLARADYWGQHNNNKESVRKLNMQEIKEASYIHTYTNVNTGSKPTRNRELEKWRISRRLFVMTYKIGTTVYGSGEWENTTTRTHPVELR